VNSQPRSSLCCDNPLGDEPFKYRVLIVDDEKAVLEAYAALLTRAAYEVRTAVDGFAALAKLRHALPDLIISDLTMPNMSGFELLPIIRRRFPHIPVIAVSAEFIGAAHHGVLADAFFCKGEHDPNELLEPVRKLIEQSPLRARPAKPDNAPVWIPRSETGYFVLTCTECLRSFSVPQGAHTAGTKESECLHCGAVVRYTLAERPSSESLWPEEPKRRQPARQNMLREDPKREVR
jgi:CheY-like chemotaxis protein